MEEKTVSRVRIGEVCEVVSGSTPRTTVAEYWGGDHPWITPAELKGDVWVYDTVKHLTQAGVESASLKIIPEGSVLLTSRAPIGKVAIAGRPMYCNQGFKNLICSDRVLNKYLYYWLKAHTDFLNSLGRGATFKEISKSIVEHINIPLPSLVEQERMAAKLDAISEIASKREEQFRKLDQLVKSRFVEMFGDATLNDRSYEVRTLKDLGKWGSGGTPSRKHKEYFEGTIDWYSAGELNDFYLEPSKEKISEEALRKSSAKLWPAGSLLVGMYDTAAFKMGYLDKPASSNQACACLVPTVDMEIRWLYCMLQVKKESFLSFRHGCRQKNLSLSQIKEFEIPFPPLALQREFAAFVAEVDKSKFAVRKSLESYQKLYRQQLQEAFG